MKTYLITGGCGFIGSNFIHYLIEKNLADIIINLDKMTYAGNIGNVNKIERLSKYTFIKGDICDRKLIGQILHKFNPNVIVNFAAESHVDRSIDGPTQFIQTNVVGTMNLLNETNKWLNRNKSEMKKDFRFIHISTDEVYGSLGNTGKFLETTPYDPSSPYSASKASSDHLARSWYRTYNFPVIITNCSNNYGPYQFPEKLIPLMITNAVAGKELPVYGNGLNIRDWLYVRDHCDAIQTVSMLGRLGETYNIGGNNEISNIEIVNIICEILANERPLSNGKSYKKQIVYVPDRPGHDYRYAIDASKIKAEFNWSPKETFLTGIKKTISWYLGNQDWLENINKSKYQQQRLGLKNT